MKFFVSLVLATVFVAPAFGQGIEAGVNARLGFYGSGAGAYASPYGYGAPSYGAPVPVVGGAQPGYGARAARPICPPGTQFAQQVNKCVARVTDPARLDQISPPVERGDPNCRGKRPGEGYYMPPQRLPNGGTVVVHRTCAVGGVR